MKVAPNPASTRRNRRLLLLGCVVAITATIAGTRTVSRNRIALDQLHAEIAASEAPLADALIEQEVTARDLIAAQNQLDELRTAKRSGETSSTESGAHAEVGAWRARVKQLKKHFADRPEKRIPELQFLSELDWASLGKTASFDTEEDLRTSLAAARTAAKETLAKQIRQAFTKLLEISKDNMPRTAAALGPYLQPPLNPTVFDERYMTTNEGVGSDVRLGLNTVIQERSPIDADYDSKLSMRPNGAWTLMSGGIAWIEGIGERQKQAYYNYGKANYGSMPQKATELYPYFNPPLDAATIEKMERAEREYKRRSR